MSENDQPQEKIRMAETPEEQKRWMAQWREAEKALLEVKRDELRAVTDADAIWAFNALDMPPELCFRFPERTNSVGFVEQQRIFGRARQHQSNSHGGR